MSSQVPAVELFTTSILSNHKVRSRHERYTSVLAVKKIPFVYHDLASDEDAKSRWRRKAKDPQIPGLLVHNEWRGTFEEFEEAVEFGELNLFLNIDPSRSQPAIPAEPAAIDPSSSSPNSKSVPKQAKLKPMPTAMPQMAPAGSGKREETPEDLIASLNVDLDSFDLSESDVSTLLEEVEAEAQANRSSRSVAAQNPKDQEQNGVGLGENDKEKIGSKSHTSSSARIGLGQPPPRTYIPSSEAGVKPLRFARMGSGNTEPQSMVDRASSINLSRSPSSNSPSSSPTNNGPHSKSNVDARYSSSSRSAKALAAEASALSSSRNFSTKSLKESIKSGQDLQNALRSVSSSSSKEHVVGRETAEDLLANLGLNDLDLTEEEAEKFLLDGEIPKGLDTSGDRFKEIQKNQLSKADKAREEVAAREVAKRARDRGHKPRDSTGSRINVRTSTSSISTPSNSRPSTAVEMEDSGERGENGNVEEEEKKGENVKAESQSETKGETNLDLVQPEATTKEVKNHNKSESESESVTVPEVEERKDPDQAKEDASQTVALETPAADSSVKQDSEPIAEPKHDAESQDTISQPLKKEEIDQQDVKDLSLDPLSTPTPSGVVSAAAPGGDSSVERDGTSLDETQVSTPLLQDQKTEEEVKSEVETHKKPEESTEGIHPEPFLSSKATESTSAPHLEPSPEGVSAQLLQDKSLKEGVDEAERTKAEPTLEEAPPAEVSSVPTISTNATSTPEDFLPEKTPKGTSAELLSEGQALSGKPIAETSSIPTNTSSSSLSSSRKGSLPELETDVPRSSSSGSERLSTSISPSSSSNSNAPISPSASKALAVSTSSTSLSLNAERRKRSGSGSGPGAAANGPSTPNSGRRALDFRRGEAPTTPISPSGSGSGRRSVNSPPPMPSLPRSLSQMSSNASSNSISNSNQHSFSSPFNQSQTQTQNPNQQAPPSSYTSPPISPGAGAGPGEGKPLKKKRSISLPRFGRKDKETKEREREEKEEKKKSKRLPRNGSSTSISSSSPHGASPDGAGANKAGGGHQRTISDILREADAAMNGELDVDDDLLLDDAPSEEEPDDGLGPAELPDEEMSVRA